MTIDCAFFCTVVTDAEPRVSKASGKPYVKLRGRIGNDDDVQWISIAVFGNAVEQAAGLKKGERAYVEGTIKLDEWKDQSGRPKSGLSVASFKCERPHVGRNRHKQKAPPAGGLPAAPEIGSSLNDEVPF
jgi:single-stranded DNA-binding protein